ncbi:MAG: hypothetical protein MZV70_39505 [Desulfobacterales bacterium]|nr:hypothetical protein [Desulfobacterales bacterium]
MPTVPPHWAALPAGYGLRLSCPRFGILNEPAATACWIASVCRLQTQKQTRSPDASLVVAQRRAVRSGDGLCKGSRSGEAPAAADDRRRAARSRVRRRSQPHAGRECRRHHPLYSRRRRLHGPERMPVPCASAGLNRVVRGSVDCAAPGTVLGLGAHQQVVFAQVVGYPSSGAAQAPVIGVRIQQSLILASDVLNRLSGALVGSAMRPIPAALTPAGARAYVCCRSGMGESLFLPDTIPNLRTPTNTNQE